MIDMGQTQRGDELLAALSSKLGTAPGATPLEEFLRRAQSLDRNEKLLIVRQAIALLEGFYVHLPLKRAMHAVEPLQRLRLLRSRLDSLDSDARFHAEMTAIFTSVRDLHTNYLLPSPFREVVASLPFRVEACHEGGKRLYIAVTVPGETMPDPAFVDGVAITHWNGVPIERAVANAADRHAGSNAAARASRGLAGLTHRPLLLVPPPDEEWAIVTFLDEGGETREARFAWQVRGLPPIAAGADPQAATPQAAALGYDIETLTIQQVRQDLFAPEVMQAELAMAAGASAGPEEGSTASSMPTIFQARAVDTPSGPFGYIRIRTFHVQVDEPFVSEFIRLISLLPQNGLIIDVRDNGGGLIWAGERLLQTLTPRPIEPERLQFINTAQTDLLAKNNDRGSIVDMSQWAPSITRSVETGAAFSCSFPITDPERCNDIGQCYRGPVVLITNARCYSTTDIFAAGFQDHEIGPVLGVDDNTGAGGANVWEHPLLLRLLGEGRDPTRPLPDSPLRPLPRNSNMRVAIRRTLRVGRQAGTELEDLGVVPDALHEMTRRDVLQANEDLIAKAASLLVGKPAYKLDAQATRNGRQVQVTATTGGIDRLDIAVDGRPLASHDVADGTHQFSVPARSRNGTVFLNGFSAGKLRTAARARY
jgi:C-terminal processing protease CtpA/Prc